MYTKWFTKMATMSDPTGQQGMIMKAEILPMHVVTTYLKDASPLLPSSKTNNILNSLAIKKGRCLMDEACDVQISETKTLNIVANSLDLLRDEIEHYIRFHRGRGDLQKPLLWWKVSQADAFDFKSLLLSLF